MIFDLGFHNGNDTEHYLSKGFSVVAVEPNPYLIEGSKKRFKKEIEDGKLILLQKAISTEKDYVNFYIHSLNSDWGSCEKWLAERDGALSRVISVGTITLTKLVELYGVPHYVKVDTEGEEILTARELFGLLEKPKYVSFETSKSTYAELFAFLFLAGYGKFQLRNQLNNAKYSSGEFGEFLPVDEWFDYYELLYRYGKYAELKRIDNKQLALGWLDVHATI